MLHFPNMPGTPRPSQKFLFIAATWLLFTSNLNAATRDELLAITPGPDLAGTATIQPVGQESFRQIVANAPVSERARFTFGKIQFNTEWDPAPGQVPTNTKPAINAVGNCRTIANINAVSGISR